MSFDKIINMIINIKRIITCITENSLMIKLPEKKLFNDILLIKGISMIPIPNGKAKLAQSIKRAGYVFFTICEIMKIRVIVIYIINKRIK
ncbi:hypothetical protein [Romboutsia ilealis]|uniref:hypothetical protein n=2 Tax=Bacillota TaxID=1239 RepID=UPI002572BFB9|nr:hypothetical protein [Romboutsia ilealis]